MGKTTNFHPVSLTVIRAAVIYCGWRFGKVRQTYLSDDRTCARYVAEVVLIPAPHANKSAKQQLKALNSCFAKDIWVTSLWVLKTGKVHCDLETSFKPDGWDDDQGDESESRRDFEAEVSRSVNI